MLTPLTPAQSQWVARTLDSLTIEQCIGQMLNVSGPQDDPAYWLDLLTRIPAGCMSARTKTAEQYKTLLTALQAGLPIPALVLANMEHGASEWDGFGTEFPWPMAAGAADDEAAAETMGAATAVEARSIGVNWVLTPVADLNYNFNNPITNVRSLGDDPARVGRLAAAIIRGIQANGVAATAKHFPGDGLDDRDQHLTSSVNPLPFAEWKATYGAVWKAVIDAGVYTIMPGHISLPDYEGYAENPEDAPPATISRKLLLDLLRGELGFEGLIVSDSTSMVGLTSRTRPEERAMLSIEAGIDVYLNANLDVDFPSLVQAVKDGRLSEARIRESARRVLELKARLNLVEQPIGPAPSESQAAAYTAAAASMADKSITILRGAQHFPLNLPAGAKVLTVSVAQINQMMGQSDLTAFDDALRARGYEVEHLLNPRNDELRPKSQAAAAVIVNVYNMPFMTLGHIRIAPNGFGAWGWRSLFLEHPNVIYCAFGTPYIGYELPHVPNLLATYGGSAVSQRAAVKVLLGELPALGKAPVRIPKVRIAPLSQGWTTHG